MILNKGIWDPRPRVTNIKGTNLKSLTNKSIDPASCGKTWAGRWGRAVEGLGHVNPKASTVSFYKEALAASGLVSQDATLRTACSEP